ncbi:MAG: alpha/beta hydrolase [Archaeoglobaceae archaeon]
MWEQNVGVGDLECRMIRGKGSGIPVVLLHGYMFTSEVWKEIGLLSSLEEQKVLFFALDMPYGAKSKCSSRRRDPELSVRIVEEAVGEEPLIVGASLGGYMALKYSVKNPVKGLVLIAPTGGLEEDLVKNYHKIEGQKTIIYGEKDEIVSLEEMKKLSEALGAELKIYENARHPAYLDYPQKFVQDVLNFYESCFK